MIENNDEKIIEEHKVVDDKAAAETEAETVAETADELVKEKANNEFIVRENTAQFQMFIQNANVGNIFGYKPMPDFIDLHIGNDKKFNLQRMEECADFFSTCKNIEYIALAIVLSVFEIVPIGDYANLKNILTGYLPAVLQIDIEGKETNVQHKSSYISLNTALSIIGGKIFIRDNGQQCIGYGEGYEKVLSNIWIQFPDLRKPVISWLLRTNEMFEYKTSFEVYQIISAFILIITEDFQYSKSQVFDRLYSEQDNLGLIARLTQELLEDKRFRTDILNMVVKWTESESNWLWKSALLVCLHTYDLDIDNQLHKALVRAIEKRMFGFQNSDLRFIVTFARNAKNVRKIMTFVFYNLYQSSNLQGKESLARIYLKMIRYGYYQVNRDTKDLPFVTCDSREQMGNIHFVLEFIMTRYDLYCQLCWILQAYLEEISGYDVSIGTLNHLTAFFYVLTKDKYDYQKDILLFLSELKGSTARKIYNQLIKIYKTNGGEKK